MHEHDVKVIFGDLNFRLSADVNDFDLVEQKIQANYFDDLLRKDEFYVFRGKDSLLKHYREG